jgi:type VI secretion system protein
MLALTLPLLCALNGCGVSKGIAKRASRVAKLSNGKLSLEVITSPDANRNGPIAVDVLLIKDKELLKTTQGMSASDWSAKKSQLQRQFPKGVEVMYWEWVPNQTAVVDVDVPVDTRAVMMFANYSSAGLHSALLPMRGRVVLSLNDEDFTVESKK